MERGSKQRGDNNWDTRGGGPGCHSPSGSVTSRSLCAVPVKDSEPGLDGSLIKVTTEFGGKNKSFPYFATYVKT